MGLLTLHAEGADQHIANTLAAFQALHEGIVGVASAPTTMQGYYDTARLPLVWTHPGPTPPGGGWLASAEACQYNRQYYVDCFVMPEGQVKGRDEGYQLAVTLLQRLGTAYLGNPNLDGQIAHFVTIEDSGITLLQRAGVQYHGFRFTVTVREKL